MTQILFYFNIIKISILANTQLKSVTFKSVPNFPIRKLLQKDMDLLPAEATTSKIVKKHGFRSLKLLTVDMDQELGDQPVGVDYGRLDNGLSYYVRCNSKPRMRAALALAVKVGYVYI